MKHRNAFPQNSLNVGSNEHKKRKTVFIHAKHLYKIRHCVKGYIYLLKNWLSFGKQDSDCIFWFERLHWRHSTEQISYNKVWESADRSRRSVQMAGQVPWATVWQELSQAPLAHRTQGEYCGRPWYPHTSTQKKHTRSRHTQLHDFVRGREFKNKGFGYD